MSSNNLNKYPIYHFIMHISCTLSTFFFLFLQFFTARLKLFFPSLPVYLTASSTIYKYLCGIFGYAFIYVCIVAVLFYYCTRESSRGRETVTEGKNTMHKRKEKKGWLKLIQMINQEPVGSKMYFKKWPPAISIRCEREVDGAGAKWNICFVAVASERISAIIFFFATIGIDHHRLM